MIYDQDESLSLVKRAIASVGLSDKTYAPRRVLSLLSMQKNGRPYSEADVRDYRLEVLNELAARYNAGLRAAKAVDFDDLLALSARLLEESDVLERDPRLAFRYILVDEYQDTNRLQYRIVRALASTHQNITVVGDEDQSIYSWRGADIRNILEFERDFPGASILRLEENYRSTQAILDAASGLVVKNENRIGKTLRAMRPGGGPVESLVAKRRVRGGGEGRDRHTEERRGPPDRLLVSDERPEPRPGRGLRRGTSPVSGGGRGRVLRPARSSGCGLLSASHPERG